MAAAVWTACTKKLFYRKKWSPGEIQGFAVFTGVFEGCFGRCGEKSLVCVGSFVVLRVVRLDNFRLIFVGRKCARMLKIFVEILELGASTATRVTVAVDGLVVSWRPR
jgi:hypothetical protein